MHLSLYTGLMASLSLVGSQKPSTSTSTATATTLTSTATLHNEQPQNASLRSITQNSQVPQGTQLQSPLLDSSTTSSRQLNVVVSSTGDQQASTSTQGSVKNTTVGTITPNVTPYSMVVLDEMFNLTQEQRDTMAFNYTNIQFSPNKPINYKAPTFAFDFRSPLKKYFPPHMKINKDPSLITEMDFFKYPEKDFLTDLYRYELSVSKVPKSFQQKVADPHLVNKDHLRVMLENAFTLPRNTETNSTMKDSVGQYILSKFGTLGLLSGTQVFIPSQFQEWFWPDFKPEDVPPGNNIIGIYPGKYYGTKQDKIIVVGAHWDTVGSSDGFNDNGSGIAATIEIARAIIESDCELRYSIIFVTFDKEENGGQGSHEFVRGFLLKYINETSWPEFQGAILMDTLLNYNESANSQVFPLEWKLENPAIFDRAEANSFKGDFITVLYRYGTEDVLAEVLRKHNENLRNDDVYRQNVVQNVEKYRYQELGLNLPKQPPEIKELTKYVQFIRSDHARFWYSMEETYTMSLKAVLLTDTGPYRGQMRECYHNPCDSKRGRYTAEFANYDFLAQTVQTVIDAVTDLAGAYCHKSERASRLKRYSMNVNAPWARTEIIKPVQTVARRKHRPKNTILSVEDLIAEEGEEEEGEGEEVNSDLALPVKSSAAGLLANTALYVAYTFKWLPSMFIMG